MNLETVNELIASLESAGELSIKERKYLGLAKAYMQLAAENVGLKESVEHAAGCIAAAEAEGLIDALAETTDERLADLVHRRLCHAYLEVKTPATDSIYAGIKADGVEMFALMFAEEAIKDNSITTGWKARASRAASEYAELLREGAK
ncbi:hypothetical protein [Raoultella ornithinolytica]|uniref:hypothetical protein n=1 Tax=Raoultella ornithinolytica TaxID=54291 RepID=UPI0013F4139B|nr:hypothetical protein [Raoultella ornithinolytica]QIJ48830.1 hypothetical protein G7Z36_11740 [Raoultella ornithinolytica]